MLRLTLLAPDIVEAILHGPQPADIGLPALIERMPSMWDEQRIATIAACGPPPRRANRQSMRTPNSRFGREGRQQRGVRSQS
jgi:hypothetical protein